VKKSTKRVAWSALALLLIGVFAIWLYGEIQIDKCLDAGGAWDYEKHRCMFKSQSE
jgi:hypothetical protein